jgi:Domain of unknown function (DUF4191)
MVKKPGSRAAQGPNQANQANQALKDLAAADPASMGRLKQLSMTIAFVRKSNPRALPIMLGGGLAVLAALVVVGLLSGSVVFLVLYIVLGLFAGGLTAMTILGSFARKAQYAALRGQPGAAVAIVQNIKGWTVTPTVAGNRNMDMVHRAIGRPGVVLIGEGSPTGLASLLAAEKRKIARIAYGTPIIELQVGEAKGQVPIRDLQRKLRTMMPRALKPRDIRELNNRFKAMPSSLQAPRGPLPQPGRMPKPPRPRAR